MKLTKQHQDIIEELESLRFVMRGESRESIWDVVSQFSKAYGFYPVWGTRPKLIFTNNFHVIKRRFNVGKMPLCAIPTTTHLGWDVQPIARRLNEEDFETWRYSERKYGIDAHLSNLGWYRGRIVAIDW